VKTNEQNIKNTRERRYGSSIYSQFKSIKCNWLIPYSSRAIHTQRVRLDRVIRIRNGLVLRPFVLRNVGALSITGVGLFLCSDDLKRWFSLSKSRCESSSEFTRAALNTPVVVKKREDETRQTKGFWNLNKYTSYGAEQDKPGQQAPPDQTKVVKDGKVRIQVFFFLYSYMPAMLPCAVTKSLV